jgi:uncharacterized protein
MMIVPTYVGPSAIEGVGVFAAEPIRAGTAIWQLSEALDLLLTEDQLQRLPELQRDFIERYGYPHMTKPGLTVLEFDNGRFMNHDPQPNTDFTSPETGWAIRDIAAGEEITCDYAEFDPSFAMQPGRRFIAAGEVQLTA